MSLRESINSINSPYKPPRKIKCEEGIPPIGQSTVTQVDSKDMARVIAHLERIQECLDNLLGLCLREGQEESSVDA